MSNLTLEELAALRDTVNSHGWPVVLKLIEIERRALQGEWIEADPANQLAVCAAQATAHGFHIGIRNFLGYIEHALREYHERRLGKSLSKEEQFIEETISPFGLEH